MWNAAVEPGWLPFASATTAPVPSTITAGMRSPDGEERSILMVNDSAATHEVTLRGLPPNVSFKVWSWNQTGFSGRTCYRSGKVSSSTGTVTLTLTAWNAVAITSKTAIAGFPPCP